MASLRKSEGRQKRQLKKKNGMRVSGASVKLIQQIQINRADKLKGQKHGKNSEQ